MRYINTVLLILLCLFVAEGAWAQGTINVPGGYATIQAAINAAGVGDVIEVADGTYLEEITLNKAVTIKGANAGIAAGANPGNRGDETIIDGGFIISGAATLDGLKIINGRSSGSLKVGVAVATSGVTVTNCIIEDVESPAQSDGLSTQTGNNNLTLTNSTVSNNWRGIYLNPGSGHVLSGNLIDSNNGVGVGIGSDGQSDLTLTGNIISNHTVEGWGSSAVGTDVVAQDNKFLDNGVSIAHYGGEPINASPNYWGEDPDFNNLVSGSVDYDPWWHDDDMTILASDKPVFNATQGTYYDNIQAAINAADPDDVIEVAAGAYTEELLINKSLTLNGVQAGEEPVEGGRIGGESVISTSGTFAVTIIANDVTIDGFEIQIGGGTSTGFGINVRTLEEADPGNSFGAYRENITIQHNYIHVDAAAGQKNGIVFGEFTGDPARSTEDALLRNLLLHNNYLDIKGGTARALVFGNHFADIVFEDVLISDNTIIAGNNGLFISANPANYLANNFDVTGNIFTLTPTGINMGNLDASSQVNNNQFIENGNGALVGWRETGGEVKDNLFEDNTGLGLYFWDDTWFPQSSTDVTVTGNTFTKNGRHVGSPSLNVDLDNIKDNNTFDGYVFNVDRRNVFGVIQTAIDWSTTEPGDVVEVAAGTYTGHFVINKDLTLKGAQFGVDANGRTGDETLIQGTFKLEVPASDVTIDGFSFQAHGASPNAFELGTPYNAAIFGESATLNISNNISNHATDGSSNTNPGLVWVTSDDLTFTNNVVTQNLDIDANAVYLISNGTANVAGNTFTGAAGFGAGADSKLTLTNNTVLDSRVEGIWFWPVAGSAELSITGNVITDFNAGNHTDVKALKIVSKPAEINNETATGNMLAALENDNPAIDSFLLDWMGPVHNVTKDLFYTTIQTAINEADADDVIKVAAGEFSLSGITLDKSITLKGNNAGIPAADGSGVIPAGRLAETVLTVTNEIWPNADNITIDGFHLKSGERVIRHNDVNANNVIIKNSIVENTSPGAHEHIHLFGPAVRQGWQFLNNRFIGNYNNANIQFAGSNDSDILIEGNDFMGTGNRALFGAPANLTIRGNFFDDSNITAINMNGLDNPLIENNTVRVNGFGLQLTTINGGIVRNNTLIGSGAYDFGGIMFMRGIDIFGTAFGGPNSSGLVIENNEFQDFTAASIGIDDQYRGIHIRQGAENITIQGNTFTNSHTGLGIVATEPETKGIEFTENDLSDVVFGVINGSSEVVDATENWWGTIDPNGVEGKVFGDVNFIPFLVPDPDGDTYPWSGTDTYSPTGFGPVMVYTEDPDNGGEFVSSHINIQDAINAATTGEGFFITVAAGTYNGNVTVNKNISLIGAGADVTILDGDDAGPGLATVFLTQGRSNVTIQGFHIKGIDNASPGIEKAAVYLQGAQTNITIRNNIIEARGDAALMGEWNAANDGIIIHNNEFTGKTFIGGEPATGNQFEVWNVARQAINFGGGTGTTNTQNFTFTNNIIATIAAGETYGNTLVTLDLVGDNVISGNSFPGKSSAHALRVRGNGSYAINNNSFEGDYPLALFRQGSTVDATENWWGTENPNEVAALVDGDVNFIPFLVPDPDGDTYPWSGTDTYSPTGFGPVMVYTEDPDNGGEFVSSHIKIQDAINATTTQAGYFIVVSAGTYSEDVLINKPLTLLGANADIPYGDVNRGTESKIQPATSGQAPIRLSGYGISDNVTINGFEITGTLANNAIYCGGDGPSYLDIKFNYIHNVGVDRGSGNVYAINYRVNVPSPTNVNISDNYITGVLNPTTSAEGHSAGIWVGQSTANGVVSNLTIERNVIKNIYSGQSNKDASGIYIGAAWGTGTGGVDSPLINNNVVTDITGGIAYGIQLSGKTPGAEVSNNLIDNISGLPANPSTAVGVAVPESNTGSGTVNIQSNSITGVAFSVFNGTATTLNATENWYGATDPIDVAGKVVGNVQFVPFLVPDLNGQTYPWSGTEKYSPTGFLPVVVYDDDPDNGGTYVNSYFTIQEAINDATTGDGYYIKVAAGTYNEDLLINKNVNIHGAGADQTLLTNRVRMAGPFVNVSFEDFKIERSTAPLLTAEHGAPSFDGVTFEGVEFLFTGVSTNPSAGGRRAITFGFGIDATIVGNGLIFKDVVFEATDPDEVAPIMILRADGGAHPAGPLTFDGVTVIGSGGYNAINTYGGINVTVKNSKTENGGAFYLSGVTDLTVTNNEFTGAGGVFVNGADGATITDNEFKDIPASGFPAINFSAAWGPEQNYNVLFENNTFSNVDVTGIRIYNYTSSDPDNNFLTAKNNDFSGIDGLVISNPFSTHFVDASENWWGTTQYSDIYNKVTNQVVFVPYHLDAEGTQSGGGPSVAVDLIVNHTAANENIFVQFEVKDGDMELYPVPGLDPNDPDYLADVTARYAALGAALESGDADAIRAAALAVGDDVIMEYYYLDGTDKVYLKTINDNDLIKNKYWNKYLVRDDGERFPAWADDPIQTLILQDRTYRTNTNPGTGSVAEGWLDDAIGKDLYVAVTLIQNGSVKPFIEPVTINVVSTYEFVYDLPDLLLKGIDAVIPVTFKTDKAGNLGYDATRFSFSATGPAGSEVTFTATDSNNDEYTFTNSGYWGPPAGFDLPAEYDATTEWTLNFSHVGEYTITFNAFQVGDEANPFASGTEVLNVESVVVVSTEPENERVYPGQEIMLPISVSSVDGFNITAYELILEFNHELIIPLEVIKENTLSENGNVTVNLQNDGKVIVAYAHSNPLADEGTLLFVKFLVNPELTAFGTTLLELPKIELQSIDGNPNIFTIIGRLIVGPLYGDVNLDQLITAVDPQLVLQYAVELIDLNYAQFINADVDGNNKVQALDASLILQYIVGMINIFPVEVNSGSGEGGGSQIASGSFVPSPSGNVAFDGIGRSEEFITIPLTIQETGSVYALELTAEFDPEVLTIEDIHTNLPDGWLMAENIGDGILRIAMAGTRELRDGVFATLLVNMKDNTVETEITAEYILNADGPRVIEYSLRDIPDEFKLAQNYPNPFNPVTTIQYQLPEDARVQLVIYNRLGQVVKTLVNEEQIAGYYRIQWDGTNNAGVSVASGLYIYRLQSKDFIDVKRMIFLK